MNPIVLLTDYGWEGPYVGQLHAVLAHQASEFPVIDLMHDLPAWNVRASAYLLPAITQPFASGSVFVCVVDPGVGGERAALAIRADSRWYVGPDNGLFTVLCQRARDFTCHEIRWRPATLSSSFHGRDLFAPAAAMLAGGKDPGLTPVTPDKPLGDWPADLDEIIYIDRFGNAMTGRRASAVKSGWGLCLQGKRIPSGKTFSSVGNRDLFWYENSNGLVEIAANRGSAAELLKLGLGTPVVWQQNSAE